MLRRYHFKQLLLLLPAYIILGALLPFMHTRQVGEDFKKRFRPETFYGSSPCTDRARIVEDSQDALDTRIQMIHQAKDRIVLTTFDIRDGESCRDIFSSLVEAADRGVKVRILVDGLSGVAHMSGNPVFYAAGSHPGIEIKFYNVPNPLKPWTFNGRMHDKYLIIDNSLLLLGGRNTYDYFLGEYNQDKLSYDRDVLIYHAPGKENSGQSGVLSQTYRYFEEIWTSEYCKTVFKNPSWFMKQKIPGALNQLKDHYRVLAAKNPDLTSPGKDYTKETVPISKATLISNPIHIFAKEPWVWYQVQYLMEHAENKVMIHTPYAALSRDMYQGMEAIASNVPSVKLLLNATSVGDNIMASSDYTRNRKKILNTGVSLYEYFGDRSSHGKSFLIDDRLSLIGSYNLDMRSTYLDTETIIVIDGEELNRQLGACIDVLAASSLKVEPDGSLESNDKVPVIPLTKREKIFFAITSRLFQLIRYLI